MSRPGWMQRALFIVLLLALGACKSRSNGRAGAGGSEAKPVSGGELIFAFDGAAIAQFQLDPHRSAFAPHHRVMRSIYESLVVALPGHRFGPWLAKSWELAPDGLSYTFQLREDVKFHDGTPFDAEAVKVNLDRVQDPKTAAYSFTAIGPYEASEVIGPHTLRVRFSKPYAPFLANLASTALAIASPKALEELGFGIAQAPVGTGPFRFESQKAGTEIVVRRNEEYRWPPAGSHHEGPAYLQRIIFKNVPEEATRVAVLENGQAGAVDLIPPQNLGVLRKDPRFRIVTGELLNQNYALYLNTAREPWKDARMRAAFRQSLDLDTAVKTIYLGTEPRAWSPLSPSLFGYDKTLEGSWRGDPAVANRTLDELGWKRGADGIRVKDGKPLSVVFLDTQGNREKRLDLMVMLRRQLRDTGFDLKLESQPQGNYMQKAASGDYDLLAGSQFAPDPDVLRRLHSSTIRTTYSIAKTNDPELERLLDQGSAEIDAEKRRTIYASAQRLILDRIYAIPTYVLIYTVASRADVSGIEIDQNGFPDLYDAWQRP